MKKRPFKANPLIRFFGKTGLPKNWQSTLKQIAEICEVDPKGFFSWEYSLQLATIFCSKLNTELPSKKNLFKIGNELIKHTWMISKLSDLKEESLIEIKKVLNRPSVLAALLSQKRIKANDAELLKYIPFMRKHDIEPTLSNKEILMAMKDMVREDEMDYYLSKMKKLSKVYESKVDFKSKTNKFKGKTGHISYHVEKSAKTLFLDSASDCCQGIEKAGETCMKFGFSQENSSFLLFSRKNKVFAQSWIIEYEDMIILDSIEAKGDVNESLIEAILSAVGQLKKDYKYVVLGKSPNTEGGKVLRMLNHKSKPIPNDVKEKVSLSIRKMGSVFSYGIYSDLKNGYFLF